MCNSSLPDSGVLGCYSNLLSLDFEHILKIKLKDPSGNPNKRISHVAPSKSQIDS